MTTRPARSAPTTLAPPLLNVDEAAAYLNVPRRWVADAVRQRRIRCTRIGKHVRFRIEHLDELVAAGERPVTVPAEENILTLRPRREMAKCRSDLRGFMRFKSPLAHRETPG